MRAKAVTTLLLALAAALAAPGHACPVKTPSPDDSALLTAKKEFLLSEGRIYGYGGTIDHLYEKVRLPAPRRRRAAGAAAAAAAAAAGDIQEYNFDMYSVLRNCTPAPHSKARVPSRVPACSRSAACNSLARRKSRLEGSIIWIILGTVGTAEGVPTGGMSSDDCSGGDGRSRHGRVCGRPAAAPLRSAWALSP